MTPEEFVKKANDLRKVTKNKEWYQVQGVVDGKTVALQAYGTWIRNFKIDNIEHGYVAGITIRRYKAYILQELTREGIR